MKKERIIAVLLLCALLAGCSLVPSKADTPTPVPVTATPEPTPEPTATPEPTPAPTPTPEPTATPTPIPTATPTAVPTPTPVPTAAPTATPTPVPEKPFVKKHPDNATVDQGGSCVFEADYVNAIWAVWHFVSPDGKTDVTYEAIGATFPNMKVENGMYSKMTLSNIPLEANGWKVYCRYTNAGGYTDTNTALLTVNAAAPVFYPVAGSYVDNIAGRGRMEVTGSSALCSVSINWSSDAWTTSAWTFSGSFDASGVMRYTNATRVTTTYDAAGSSSSQTDFTNGSGTLTYSPAEDSLTWKDDHGNSGTFVRSLAPEPTATAAPAVNQWLETNDLDAAVRNAGVEFHPPVPEALPEGLSLDIYRSMSGIIEARYSSGTMLIRKSNTVSGSDLSGDMNVYSQTWEHAFKNVGPVRCRGNGDTVNEATFSAGGYNYSITYHSGQEGLGLTLDQINSIIQGM